MARSEISNQQMYDLMLDVLQTIDRIDAKLGETLVDARALNQQMASHRNHLSKPSRTL